MTTLSTAQPVLAAGLEVQGLAFGYVPGRTVIHDITASLSPGRVCALIGPNATGKTTLLRLIMGQFEPWKGQVLLEGKPVAELSPARRAAVISYVPQRGYVNFAFTVEQVVAMGRFALRRDDAAVESALDRTDLLAHRTRIYNELSAGQQQRVLLARAIAQAADHVRPAASPGRGVMLLDEPVSMMDLRHVHQTMTILRELADAGLAVMVVLHDLNLASRYADEVWLLHEGRVAAAGPWEQVLQPQVLEPIYRVKLESRIFPGSDRPVFVAELPQAGMMES